MRGGAGCLGVENAAQFLRQLFCARRKKLRNAGVLRVAVQRVRGLAAVASDLLEQRPDAVPPAELLRLWQLWKSLDPASTET